MTAFSENTSAVVTIVVVLAVGVAAWKSYKAVKGFSLNPFADKPMDEPLDFSLLPDWLKPDKPPKIIQDSSWKWPWEDDNGVTQLHVINPSDPTAPFVNKDGQTCQQTMCIFPPCPVICNAKLVGNVLDPGPIPHPLPTNVGGGGGGGGF